MAKIKYPYQVNLKRAANISYDSWIIQWRELATWCDTHVGRGTEAWEFYRNSTTNTFMFTTPEAQTIFLLRWGNNA